MRLADWLHAHAGQGRVTQTEIGIDQQRRIEEKRLIQGMGETAAFELLDRLLAAESDARARLLYEDADVARRRGSPEGGISLISTGDFLRGLQAAGRIQSAERILEIAAATGRNVDQLRRLRSGEAAEVLRGHLDSDG